MNLTAEQQGVVRNIIKDIKQNNKQVIKMGGFAGVGIKNSVNQTFSCIVL